MPIQTLLDAALDIVIVADSTGRIVSINAQPEALFSIERHELVGQPIESLIPERFRERHSAHRNDRSSSASADPMPRRLNVTGRRRDGGEFRVEVELAPVQVGPDTFLCGIIREPTVAAKADAASVLFISDDSAVAEATSMLLRAAGYGVICAWTAEESLARLAPGALPDVIVCDVYQSDAEAGADAVAWLRAQTGTMIPAIVITCRPRPEDTKVLEACRFLAQSGYASELISELEALLDA